MARICLALFPTSEHAELKRRIDSALCIDCGQPFTDANVHTDEGWRETKISGMCEDCFDALFAEDA